MNTDNLRRELWIDDRRFEVSGFREFALPATAGGGERRAFAFDFKVTHDEYHDVATLLYKGEFRLRVPAIGLDCRADIHNYSTSLDNLYEKGAVGDYHLELARRD